MTRKTPEYSPMVPDTESLALRARLDDRVPEIFAPLLSVSTPQELAERTNEAMRKLGFESFTYGASIRMREGWDPWYASWTTLSKVWVARYHEMNYVETDPRIAFGFGSLTPLTWDRSTLGTTREFEAFLDDASRFGLCCGIVFHIPGPGIEHHMTSFNSSKPTRQWINDSITGQASLFSTYFHAWFRKVMIGGHIHQHACGQPLSARERECLGYLIRGYTNADIAVAMSIKERTAGYYVGQILAKLEAANRTEAVARALRERLIDA